MSLDPRVADLVRAGRIRFAVFPPQYTKDATGALGGPWLAVMRALASRIGVAADMSELANPDKLIESLAAGTCDIGSLGFDPTRAGKVGGFTSPFMRMEYAYLVQPGSEIRFNADVDRPGVRVAAVRFHASTLALSRILRRAEQVDVDTPQQAFDLLRNGDVHAWASIRPALVDYAKALPGSVLLAESYGANLPALVVPIGQPARLAYASEFIAEAKASGLLATIIAQYAGYQPAPQTG